MEAILDWLPRSHLAVPSTWGIRSPYPGPGCDPGSWVLAHVQGVPHLRIFPHPDPGFPESWSALPWEPSLLPHVVWQTRAWGTPGQTRGNPLRHDPSIGIHMAGGEPTLAQGIVLPHTPVRAGLIHSLTMQTGDRMGEKSPSTPAAGQTRAQGTPGWGKRTP